MPPSTLKAEVVENNDFGAHSLKELDVNNLEPVHHTEEDIIININDSTDGNKRAMEFTELVGCYEHPIPVLSLLLSVRKIDVNLCVVCGLIQERERIIFMYKVVIGVGSFLFIYFYYYVGPEKFRSRPTYKNSYFNTCRPLNIVIDFV